MNITQEFSKSMDQLCYQLSYANVNITPFRDSDSVYDFIAEFELATAGLCEEQKVLLLAKGFPPGKYKYWFENNLKPLIDGKKSWQEAKVKLIERFAELNDRNRHFIKLKKLEYDPDGRESLTEFVDEVTHAYKKAIGARLVDGEEDDMLLIQHIKASLPSSVIVTLSVYTDYRNAKTIDELYKAFREYDSFRDLSPKKSMPSQKGLIEFSAVFQQLISGLKQEQEATRDTIVAAIKEDRQYRSKFEEQRYRDMSPHRRNSSEQHMQDNRENYRYPTSYIPPRTPTCLHRDSGRRPSYGSPRPIRRNEKVNSSFNDRNVQPQRSAFNSEVYYDRFGVPAFPCELCGDMHHSRHCLANWRANATNRAVLGTSNHDHCLLTAYFDICGKTVSVMVDTGATISILPEKGVIMELCRPKILPASLNVRLGDDSFTHIDKKAEVVLRPQNSAPHESYQAAQFYIQNGNQDMFGHQALVGLNVIKLFNLHILTQNCIVHVFYNGRSIGKQMPMPDSYKGSITVDKRFEDIVDDDPGLSSILRKYKEAFTDLGPLPIKGKPMRILTTHQRPIFSKQRHYSPEEITNMKPIIEDLRKKGFIEPATSGYAANSKLVKKKNGTWRLVINYIPLNAVTLRDSYVIPQIQDIFGVTQGKEYFSTLDCAQGFYQILVDPRDKHKTAFSSPFGNYQFKRCPFGARNSCAAFQAQMNEIFFDGLYTKCAIYVDDILVFGKDKAEHDRNLAWILAKCTEYNVKIKLEKCHFRKREVQYLGFSVSGNCIRPVQNKVDEISKGEPPRDKTGLRSIVGKLNFYSRFIPEYSKKLEPLRELFRQNRGFSWKPYHQAALDSMVQALNKNPMHILVPRSEHKYVELHIMTDSFEALCISDSGQLIDRIGRFMSAAEANYSIGEKQLTALKMGLDKFKIWLDPEKFTVVTSSKDLEKIFGLVNRPDRVEKILLSLPVGFDEFKFQIKTSLTTNPKDKVNLHLPEEVYYVDGACRHNGKPDCKATWAVCAEFDRDIELTGYVLSSPSNQSAELTAAVKACEEAKRSGYKSITIVTDSKYLHGAMTVWIDTWAKNDWLDHKKKPVVNVDLFKQLLYAKDGLEIEWIHVKGHADSEGNNRADSLARGLLDKELAVLCAARPMATKLQVSDPEVKELIRKIDDGETQDYVVEDGVVFYIDPKLDYPENKRIYVPEKSRYYLLSLAHDNPMYGGHLGIKKTHRKLSRFWWPQMHRQIEEYIKTCDSCQRYKEPKGLPPGYMHNIPVSRVFQHVHIDMIGPVGATERGNMYVITATDAFTKWAIVKPVKSIKTLEVLRFLNENVLAIHGAPEVIISDRGSQFTSKEWKEIMVQCNLKHNLTCSYHPQSNGTDERVNGTIVRILRHYVDKYHTDWDEKIRWAVFLYNTTVHESTGYSPYQMLYGCDPRSPLREGQSQDDDIIQSRLTRDEIRRRAAENIKASQATQKEYYDRHHRPFDLKIGDLVLVREHTVPSELTKKFYAKWDGPMMITGFIGDSENPKAISVRDLTTLERSNVAIAHVKPYLLRENDPHQQQKEKGEVQVSATERYDPVDFIDLSDDKTHQKSTNGDHRGSYSQDLSEISICHDDQPLSSSRRVTFADGAPETLMFEPDMTTVREEPTTSGPIDQATDTTTIDADKQDDTIHQDLTDKSVESPGIQESTLAEPTEMMTNDTIICNQELEIPSPTELGQPDRSQDPSATQNPLKDSPYVMDFIQDDSVADPLYVPPTRTATPESHRSSIPAAPRKARNSTSRLFGQAPTHTYNLRSRVKLANNAISCDQVREDNTSKSRERDEGPKTSVESHNTSEEADNTQRASSDASIELDEPSLGILYSTLTNIGEWVTRTLIGDI